MCSWCPTLSAEREKAGAPGAWLVECRLRALFRIGIPQEFAPPFFVFLAGDLTGGISPLQELQRRLHLPIGDSSHRHQEGKEDDPEENPKKPPKPMHSPKIVVHG